jgi:hypothetical protein
MTERTKAWILAALGVVLAVVVFYTLKGGSTEAVAPGGGETVHPIGVENPALHLDRIERLRKLEYHPTGRDIFTAELPPPPRPKPAAVPPPQGPALPPPEPPLTVPFKFYGFSDDAVTKKRRGFFTNGEDIFIATEGETVQGKFRIVSIGNTSAEVEEVGSSRRAKLNLEAPGGSSPENTPQR